MQEEQELSPKEQEQNEIDILLDKGMSFKVGNRTFIMQQPYYGTLDYLADIFVKIEVDYEALNKDGVSEGKRMAGRYTKLCAEAIAVSVLRTKWKIRLFRRSLTRYILWNVTPSVMHELARRLNASLNLGDFIHSTVLMSATRITMPTTVEENIKA